MLVFRTLQLIVPLAGAVAIAALPTAQQTAAQTQLQVMQAIVTDLPAMRRHEQKTASGKHGTADRG